MMLEGRAFQVWWYILYFSYIIAY